MSSRTGLEYLVSSIRFIGEHKTLYLLPGLFLAVSLPAYASVAYVAIYHGVEEAVNTWYRNLALLYLAYVLSASYTAYRFNKLVQQHLIDSGITTYYWLKLREDYSAIKHLYRSSVVKRSVPSPITSFVLVLFTMGLAYPIILYVLEKNLRIHAYGEEKILLNRGFTRRIDVGQALIDIAASILTIGIYMVYWGYRVVNTYNKHLRIIHKNHPEPPSLGGEAVTVEGLPDTPILAIGVAVFGAGLYGLLGLYGLPCYLPTTLGYGLLIASVSYGFSREPLSYHLGKTYLAIYFFFIVATIMGVIGAPSYRELFKSSHEQLSSVLSNDLYILTRNIFVNNLAISLVSMSPLIGPMYLGVGMVNAALLYGYVLAVEVPKGNISLLILPILPHTILELFGYSVFTAISTRIISGNIDDVKYLVVLGIFILLVAAFIESLTVLAGTPQ